MKTKKQKVVDDLVELGRLFKRLHESREITLCSVSLDSDDKIPEIHLLNEADLELVAPREQWNVNREDFPNEFIVYSVMYYGVCFFVMTRCPK